MQLHNSLTGLQQWLVAALRLSPVLKHSPPKCSSSKPKVSVSGARKFGEPWERPQLLQSSQPWQNWHLWAVSKYKPDESSSQLKGQQSYKVVVCIKYIFSTLESEWEQVPLKTNWKFEPLLKLSNPIFKFWVFLRPIRPTARSNVEWKLKQHINNVL